MDQRYAQTSYLVRKNPAALVRAFAASGLGAQGWTLVLKTKHLMDRPEDGAAFKALAESTPAVHLIDRSLDPATLADLVAAADIYASPHCSEGFGLTIAEAMAAGKPVVSIHSFSSPKCASACAMKSSSRASRSASSARNSASTFSTKSRCVSSMRS